MSENKNSQKNQGFLGILFAGGLAAAAYYLWKKVSGGSDDVIDSSVNNPYQDSIIDSDNQNQQKTIISGGSSVPVYEPSQKIVSPVSVTPAVTAVNPSYVTPTVTVVNPVTKSTSEPVTIIGDSSSDTAAGTSASAARQYLQDLHSINTVPVTVASTSVYQANSGKSVDMSVTPASDLAAYNAAMNARGSAVSGETAVYDAVNGTRGITVTDANGKIYEGGQSTASANEVNQAAATRAAQAAVAVIRKEETKQAAYNSMASKLGVSVSDYSAASALGTVTGAKSGKVVYKDSSGVEHIYTPSSSSGNLGSAVVAQAQNKLSSSKSFGSSSSKSSGSAVNSLMNSKYSSVVKTSGGSSGSSSSKSSGSGSSSSSGSKTVQNGSTTTTTSRPFYH
ncbi:MAG TPA: hypothetical protein O0X39_04220 [Methanocorpusculum sp.]|nr:hypothetical protein [Methanocorpusculum sp.]